MPTWNSCLEDRAILRRQSDSPSTPLWPPPSRAPPNGAERPSRGSGVLGVLDSDPVSTWQHITAFHFLSLVNRLVMNDQQKPR